MAAITAPQQRPLGCLQLLLALALPLLLFLPSGAATGSPCFMNKMCRLKKRTISWKVETLDRSSDSEAQSDETTTPIPEAHEIPHHVRGKEERTVGVYILIYSNNLILHCLTKKLLRQRIFDPIYQWTGPLGQITKGKLPTIESQRFVLTEDGNLQIYHIQGSDSGGYSCRVNYLYNDEEFTTEVSFIVSVYHKPKKSLHLSSEFTAESCENNAVASFEKHLLEKLEALIQNLGCEIKQWSTRCHASADTLEKLTHKFTFQFAVFPLVLTVSEFCRSSQCENSTSSIKKAYAKIKHFIEGQNTDSSLSDNLGYIPGSFTGFKEDHCKPGFGKNVKAINNHTICAGCCVTCPPGSFSAKYDTTCTLCAAGSYNEKYGQEACKNCPEAKSSDGKGAMSKRNCHRILPVWLVCLISSTATILILVAAWLIITKFCKKSIAAQYIREGESELKKRLRTFANIASDAEIQEQRSKLSPIKIQRRSLPKFKADFLEEESMGLLSNDEATEPSTPADISLSPDQTGLETSFEDQSPPPLEKENISLKDLLPNEQRMTDVMKHKKS
ncbi:zona pellucida-binding protein 2-like [Tiliqua scincoides]|uniref:zona pellucida-binding protein 2-like n=1 Tax=Tiliqua scincoides TaxID=71010 RepID=UPI0034628594